MGWKALFKVIRFGEMHAAEQFNKVINIVFPNHFIYLR